MISRSDLPSPAVHLYAQDTVMERDIKIKAGVSRDRALLCIADFEQAEHKVGLLNGAVYKFGQVTTKTGEELARAKAAGLVEYIYVYATKTLIVAVRG